MTLSQLIGIFFPESNPDVFDPNYVITVDGVDNPKNINDIIFWPPNTFIILFNILYYTDKYRRIVSPYENRSWDNNKKDEVKSVKEEWVSSLNNIRFNSDLNSFGPLLKKHLMFIFSKNNLDVCIYELCRREEFLNAVFILISASDSIFDNYNFVLDERNEESLSKGILVRAVKSYLNDSNSTSSVDETSYINSLSDNHTKNGFITLKNCVPQSGLTSNNITHNLTYIKPTVKPKVALSFTENKNKSKYNILVLPWPFSIKSDDFKRSNQKNNIEMDEYFDFFDYKPSCEIDINLYLKSLISAMEKVGSIDLVVFPECALSESEYKEIVEITEKCFGESSPNILSGVYGHEDDTNNSINKAVLSFIDTTNRYSSAEQRKHHRWYLDRNQLRNYNLSGVLSPDKKHWENISVKRRNLLVLHTPKNINLCPLICEDLARQEPVAQAVRALGANLVVSLLLDGPQMKFRWPGKYAAVLTDDPGSSVLSVTALGMTLRSTGDGHDPSRIVALWNDQEKGVEELTLKENGVGIVIETDIVQKKMWTIDGRMQEKYLVIKNHHKTIYEKSHTLDDHPKKAENNRAVLVKILTRMNKQQ
ncbi:hypothetical protein KEC58_21810 (plasmid) [Photobacterium damselae]|uniref:hypothetical protein n=1 Tax=Photobacterium damselae TaxID=38293 RepID=UPI00254273EA